MSVLSASEQIITDKFYMISLLRRLKVTRGLISFRIGKEPTAYTSIVLDTSFETKEFFLDELGQEQDHRKIKKGVKIHFDGRLSGVNMKFSSKVTGIDEDDNLALYRIALPERMTYQQRRRHYRASVNEDHPLGITLPLPLRHPVSGDIVDLSASGFCTRLKYSDSINLQEDQAIYDVTLNLPGSNHIICDIEVRNVRQFPNKGYSLIGSRFIEIKPNQQTHLERVVAMLDRNQRRTVG